MSTIAISSYEIINKIYESDRSVVYRAWRIRDRQPIILKILKAEQPSLEELIRYKQEYEITHSLNLSRVVKAYSLENFQNTVLITLEDVGGESLEILSKAKKIGLKNFLEIAILIVESLCQVHAANIIHKDISPANIVFNSATKQLKITDFGVATVLSKETPNFSHPSILEGTLNYISPEQTGRMNRNVDYRTDFYSLGATFYQLLTHQLPFDTDDPLELIHCHLAKQPIPPHQIDPSIPLALSQIIIKLLAKTAEARYQSAWGIRADLKKCWQQLENNHTITEFELGKEDVSDKLQIPQKLYGREREIKILLAAFGRVCEEGQRRQGGQEIPITNYQFKPELVLVRGYAGIGKSSLVQETFKLVTQKKGYFVQGKYEQYQRHIPYFGLIKALQELVRQLLLEDSDRLAKWRDCILTTCGENIGVLIDVVPDLSLLLGQHSAIATLNSTTAEHRFKLVFQKLIQVFAQAEHPLIIFLDDLQWVDRATLQLIQILVAEGKQYLFLIGAYRDNEVNVFHPLSLSLEELTKFGVTIHYISLTPLNISQINQLLLETLKCDREVTEPLAKLILETTRGNPFFISEFIAYLEAEDLLKFERARQIWYWNLTEIQLAQATHNNLTELLVKKIQKLDNNTQQILKLAACIGSSFELSTLVGCMTKPAEVIVALLQPAIAASLIIPIGNDRTAIELGISLTRILTVRYKFAHDRIQQAAYSSIPEGTKQTLHQIVGRTLLQNTLADKQEEKIFDIVNHLNFSISLLQNQTEKDELAALNLTAAKKAKESIAYESALSYASLGIKLIEEKSWQRQYELSLALFLEAAAAAYLCGKFTSTENYTDIVLQQAKNLLDKVKVYEIKILAHVAQGKPLAAVSIAIYALRLLGVNLPHRASKFKILLAAIATKFSLCHKHIEALINLPSMSNPHTLAAMKIMGIAGSPTYNAAPQFAPLLAFAGVNLSLKYGNTAMSAYGYASYGVMLCGILGNIDAGYQFGKLALDLLEKFQAKELKARTFMVFNNFIRHWKEHVREGLPSLIEAYQSGLDTGDIEFAAYCGFIYCYHSYFVGKELTALAQEMETYLQASDRLKQETALNLLQLYRQSVANLLETTENPCFFRGKYYDEKKMLSLLLAVNHKTALFHLYCQKLVLNYLFEAYECAAENALQAKKYTDGVIASLSLPIFNFYHSLTLISTYSSTSIWQKKRILKLVKMNQRQMQKWANSAPMNYLHKYYLVEAERNRVLGNCNQAIDNYDRAITLAQKNAYLQEEALANELAAKFYLELGKDTIARIHLLNARSCYLVWGAIAKVKALDTKYARLLFTLANQSHKFTASHNINIHTSDRLLDLNTFIKAAQIVSGEIVFQDLIHKIMQTAIENAGAELGFLLLIRDQKLVIEAAISIASSEQTLSFPMAVTSDLLPISLINYVAEHKLDVVLQNTIDSYNFARDPYVQSHKPKSVLCAPILNQNQLVGIFYLENNLATGAFTSDRLEILRLLCSQAAISLKNAQLYQDLQRSELKEREKASQLEKSLKELQIAQDRLVQVQEQLLHDAFHDPLTDLPNRAWLIERLEQAIEMHKCYPDYLYALLFIDLDRFKVVNDSLGHLVGDELIKSVASRLKLTLRASDTVARLGGDEFVILLENIRDLEEATVVADRIQARLKQPYRLLEYEVFTSASIGITFSTMNYERASDVLRDADAAMYHAKEQHKGRYQIFAPAMQARAIARLQLESDLRRAIAQQELSLHYQPIIQLSSGCLTGFEALIRWYHPQQGWIAPTEFIPVAEETGLIDSLGWWVLQQACLQLQTWRERFPKYHSLAVNVNLSVQQLKQADAAERIEQILQTTQLPGECLKLEITESCLLETADLAPQLLERLQALGVQLCIDDFGTGYSSLSRLHDLPIDTLKIDRSFVNHLESSRHTEIVQTIVTLARSLGIDAVAEGIETQLQLEKLQQLGCDLGQGYLFSQPVDSQKAEKWLNK
ncbi:MAG: Serine/threonine-protein kinase PknD [Chroococcidiopsis cubana SAG 39.79]|uniref:Serine/threonine protein kinase n=3 Tax=Chroococcidiopsis TaxID=54298 RepID=A0AB37ULE5_9CYAN|nr:EAL domain-containing protein [Chroococcidiopsis cubana]MDZ4872596.1 Serine/threonine-protein kinase PknD [Chroococcidiopsis cubana SAG 39.79]RUT12185.1 serine/threonine protein kinase [Chroococcidiopsis cubana SAG 39.79]